MRRTRRGRRGSGGVGEEELLVDAGSVAGEEVAGVSVHAFGVGAGSGEGLTESGGFLGDDAF